MQEEFKTIGKIFEALIVRIEKLEAQVKELQKDDVDTELWNQEDQDNIDKLNKAIVEANSRPRSDNYEEIKKKILEDD